MNAFRHAGGLGQRVHAMSDGRFQIRVYPAGEMVPGLQVMDAVQQGTVQIGQTASYYFTGKNPALAFDCCVPFGLTSRQQTAWLLEGGGLELMRELFADFNIINFLAGNTGVQMGGWFKREIHGPDDLKGLKMRIPGLGGEVMNRLGATVQVLAGGEVSATAVDQFSQDAERFGLILEGLIRGDDDLNVQQIVDPEAEAKLRESAMLFSAGDTNACLPRKSP